MSSFRYKAFISYSHADQKPAVWLHKQLERYRTPKRLTQEGGAPDNVKPVFRDREELSSSASLSEAIETALAESESLIVVCSHHTAFRVGRHFSSVVPEGYVSSCG